MTKTKEDAAPVKVSAKPSEKKSPAKQPNLFGEADEIFNALETERLHLVDEIKDCYKAIDRKKAVIRVLDDRKRKLDSALVIAKKQRDALTPEKKK